MRQQIALSSLFRFSYDRMISQPAVGTIHPLGRPATFTKNSNRSELTAYSEPKRRNPTRPGRVDHSAQVQYQQSGRGAGGQLLSTREDFGGQGA